MEEEENNAMHQASFSRHDDDDPIEDGDDEDDVEEKDDEAKVGVRENITLQPTSMQLCSPEIIQCIQCNAFQLQCKKIQYTLTYF